jgi:hypothetical protein
MWEKPSGDKNMLHVRVHPDNPQPRLISQAVERIRAGG